MKNYYFDDLGNFVGTFKNFKLKSQFINDKPWNVNDHNYNNHKITVTNTETKKSISFEFWGSMMNPQINSKSDLLGAFEAFLLDSIYGNYDFEEFCQSLGYNPDSIKDYKIYQACVKSYNKLEKISSITEAETIIDLINE